MPNIRKTDEIINRLILIGNGFDLAHELPTKYENFILYILKRDILNAMQTGQTITNSLYEIIPNRIERDYSIDSHKTILDILEFHSIVKRTNQNDFTYVENFEIYKNRVKYSHDNESNSYYGTTIFFKHIFLKKSIENIQSITWTGFETLYYETMLDIIHDKTYNGNKKHELEMIRSLNNYFNDIKNEFKKYIADLHSPPLKIQLNHNIMSKLKRKINENPNPVFNNSNGNNKDTLAYNPERILLLNFNYTNICSLYRVYTQSETTIEQIDIHGNYSNEIIFGYGDEIDENYIKIENKNNKEYLKHFKTFNYFQNSEYSKFLGFINSAPFEVFIMGHSCGLSDRVMLNTLFEHEYCKSIKIYYHKHESKNTDNYTEIKNTDNYIEIKNTDNYTEITQNISRHFSINNRAKLREKIVSKDKCEPLLP